MDAQTIETIQAVDWDAVYATAVALASGVLGVVTAVSAVLGVLRSVLGGLEWVAERTATPDDDVAIGRLQRGLDVAIRWTGKTESAVGTVAGRISVIKPRTAVAKKRER